MISGFHHEVDEICVLLGCYTVYGANSNLSVPPSRIKYSWSHL